MLADNGEVWTPEVQKRLDAEERAYAMRGGPRRRRDRNE
jgi:hypothetical protein